MKKLDTRDLSLTAIFTSLYAVIVVVQTEFLGPLTYGPIQLRIADCLIPLAALFGWPVVMGVTVGCFVGNTYYWLGVFDVTFGPIANFMAASVILLLRRHRLLACVVGAILVGVVVGSYLWLFFPPPSFFGLSLPEWAAMALSLIISSLVAMAGIGYSLLIILSRPTILEPLRSRGLKVVAES